MADIAAAWDGLLTGLSVVFTVPSFTLFRELCDAWALCPGRRTVTRMLCMLRTPSRRKHDAYHRFLRAGAWCIDALFEQLARRLVASRCKDGPIDLDLDDTLFHKSGRKVDGAGIYRDAVRSTGKRVVCALGLNLVVLTLRVRAPWGGEPLGLPVLVRLHRKGGPTLPDLAEALVQQFAGWFPDRRFRFCADGAYASLAGRRLPRTHTISRMRRDAALHRLPPARKSGTRGRPAKKGKKLPTPERMAKSARTGWEPVDVDFRGRIESRLLLCLRVLWYRVCPDHEVLLVVVRDPSGKQPDDFFFTTDVSATPASVVSHYAGRWSIEDTFRNVKQLLGGQNPQTWVGRGPERAASLSFWLYSAIWECYLTSYRGKPSWIPLPWYTSKKTPSFADALAALRRALWTRRISVASAGRSLPPKSTRELIEALAMAA